MGFDRIRFFDGPHEQSTLIWADKCSAQTVYSRHFTSFLNCIGYRACHAVDESKPTSTNAAYLQRKAEIITFPPTTKTIDQFGSKIGDVVVKVEPPVTPEDMRKVMHWLDIYCDPSDAGPLYLDNRGGHFDCSISTVSGMTECKQ